MNSEQLISNAFVDQHPSDAAQIIERFRSEDITGLLVRIDPARAAAVMEQMSPVTAAASLGSIETTQAVGILGRMPFHTAANLVRRIPPPARSPLLNALPTESAEAIRRLLQYADGTAGSLMDPMVLTLPRDLTVGQAIGRLRRFPQQMVSYFYIVERTGVLAGVISLKELFLARPSTRVDTIMKQPATRVNGRASRDAVVRHPGWAKYHKLPVVDDSEILVGVIRYKTLRSIEGQQTVTPWSQSALSLVMSLGEAYWTGLSAMFYGLHPSPQPPPDQEAKK